MYIYVYIYVCIHIDKFNSSQQAHGSHISRSRSQVSGHIYMYTFCKPEH